MNWENYSKLTEKQKEEYNFKFKDKIEFNLTSVMLIVINLFLTIGILYLTAYMVMNNPPMFEYKDSVPMMAVQAAQVFFVIVLLVLGFSIEYLFRIVLHFYRYNKWIKENNIVIETWWSKWRK